MFTFTRLLQRSLNVCVSQHVTKGSFLPTKINVLKFPLLYKWCWLWNNRLSVTTFSLLSACGAYSIKEHNYLTRNDAKHGPNWPYAIKYFLWFELSLYYWHSTLVVSMDMLLQRICVNKHWAVCLSHSWAHISLNIYSSCLVLPLDAVLWCTWCRIDMKPYIGILCIVQSKLLSSSLLRKVDTMDLPLSNSTLMDQLNATADHGRQVVQACV